MGGAASLWVVKRVAEKKGLGEAQGSLYGIYAPRELNFSKILRGVIIRTKENEEEEEERDIFNS